MQIGDVARKLDMPASTIRYYEKVGLIERQQRVSGRRQFNDRALFALRFVQLAQAAGFTIGETVVCNAGAPMLRIPDIFSHTTW